MTETTDDSYLRGPDQIKPADSYRTWKPDGTVKLRPATVIGKDNQSKSEEEIISIPTQLKRTVLKFRNKIAIRYIPECESSIKEITYREYGDKCHAVAKAFLRLGLERYHAVCIIGNNSPEWIYSAMGAILAGGFQAGIYPTSSAEAIYHCLNLSQANIVVVEDGIQLNKLIPIRHKLQHLKVMIQYKGKPSIVGAYSWEDVMRIGYNEPDEILDEVQKTIAVNECCTIIYTSGTTGLPKAVMLNHANIIHGTRAMKSLVITDHVEGGTLCYLPMNHIASQMTDMFLPLTSGTSVYIADNNCLKNTLVTNLKRCQPEFLLGVPRVWEKLKDELVIYETNACFVQRRLISVAKHVALNRYRNLSKGIKYDSALYKLFQRTIYKKMRSAIGLNNCKYQMTGGAPTLPDTIEYFYSLDIPIINGYGMSEAGGMCTASSVEDYPAMHVGKVQDDIVQVKILNPDSQGSGEIFLNGRGLFMGYLNDEKNTIETIESDGWMHSGDVGALDSSSKLKITGRIKEIIITAGGENIPAPLIENAVKSQLPIVSNAVLIGDKRKYLTILLTLKSLLDPVTGTPSDHLAQEAVDWCRALGCNYIKISEILHDKPEPVYAAIQKGIDRANQQALSNAQKIQKFTILPRDFSTIADEIGPTLKLKRPVIYQKYADEINGLYL